MSVTQAVTVAGLEARVHLTPNPYGTHASVIVFDEDADIVFDGNSTNYQGYCRAEILYSELCKGFSRAPHIDADDIAAALDAAGHICTCDDDEDDLAPFHIQSTI